MLKKAHSMFHFVKLPNYLNITALLLNHLIIIETIIELNITYIENIITIQTAK